MQSVQIYDTTLRDGSQTEGISFSVSDKLKIVKELDKLGVGYIEGGWPGSNIKDLTFFKEIKKVKLRNSKIVAFGSTHRADAKVYHDANIKALLDAPTEIITIFGKSWNLHVRDVLRVSLDKNLKMIEDTIRYLRSKGRTVIYDAEHFFDGYKDDPSYALKTILAACNAGASIVVFCDTNGGTLTSDVVKIVKDVKNKLNMPLGIHAHNDCDLAVSNSIAAVEAGCSHVQGTINGYGERCGNANLCTIIGILKLKLSIDCISNSKLKELTEVSRYIAEVSNMRQEANAPFVGNSAFAHKAGVHINAVLKTPFSYEHVKPELVGNRRRFLISELSGKSAIITRAKKFDLDLGRDTSRTKKILKLLQDLEHRGYQFEAAEGSFQLLIKKALKRYNKFFQLQGFRVIIEKREDNQLISEATIKVRVKGKEEHTAALGDGPVNALDNALRKALLDFYPTLAKMHLSDFKVRVLDEKEGTAASVRVLIQSQDEKDSWSTVGVSENIIEASWQALVDSIEYKLLKDKVCAK